MAERNWESLGVLPRLRLSASDQDVLDAVRLGLLPPRVAFSDAAGQVAGTSAVLLCDAQATPVSLAEPDGEQWRLTSLVEAESPDQLPDTWTGPVVVVDGPLGAGEPPAAEPVLWLVPARSDASGHRLLAEVRRNAGAADRVFRLPVGGTDDDAVLRTRVPSAEEIADRLGAGEVTHRGTPGTDHGGTVVFFTGLSGSGKSTVANALMAELAVRTGRPLTLLDGDEVRSMLSAELGFDAAGRAANIQRIAWVAALAARHGGIAVAAPIAPFAAGRTQARRMAREVGDFLLVWISTDLATCEQRDRKGLYARARAGDVAEFTGISSPYETPDDADLVIDTAAVSVAEAVELIVGELRARGRLESAEEAAWVMR